MTLGPSGPPFGSCAKRSQCLPVFGSGWKPSNAMSESIECAESDIKIILGAITHNPIQNCNSSLFFAILCLFSPPEEYCAFALFHSFCPLLLYPSIPALFATAFHSFSIAFHCTNHLFCYVLAFIFLLMGFTLKRRQINSEKLMSAREECLRSSLFFSLLSDSFYSHIFRITL